MTHAPGKPVLRRVLRVRDLVFFYVTAVLGMRWVGTAAAAGPSALVIWIVAALTLFVPLAFTVIELSSRYPDEGGIYVWTRHAFGDFARVHDRMDLLGSQPHVPPRTPVLRRQHRALHLRRPVRAPAGLRHLLHRSSPSPDWPSRRR